MNDVTALEGRVTRLESAISDGFRRVEELLTREITDLKNEQINDLRKAQERLADDQREMWKALRLQESFTHQRQGSSKTIGGISNFLSAGLGGLIAAIAAYLSSGGKPHP
jgi:hypothetical protein